MNINRSSKINDTNLNIQNNINKMTYNKDIDKYDKDSYRDRNNIKIDKSKSKEKDLAGQSYLHSVRNIDNLSFNHKNFNSNLNLNKIEQLNTKNFTNTDEKIRSDVNDDD